MNNLNRTSGFSNCLCDLCAPLCEIPLTPRRHYSFAIKTRPMTYFRARQPRGPGSRRPNFSMPVDLPQTTSKIDGPLVKQFSIFLPNKVGAMLDVVKLLHTHNTHVVALSISESTDSAIARIVVSDPEQVEELFRRHDVPFGVCSMVVVELREVATELAKLLAALLMAEVNVHFTYPLLTHPRGFAALALHVDDTDCATSVLLGEGFKLLSQADISR
jgi:hypothetical protein